jgi:hypothetical protein
MLVTKNDSLFLRIIANGQRSTVHSNSYSLAHLDVDEQHYLNIKLLSSVDR